MKKFAEKTVTYIQVPLKSLERIILFFFFPSNNRMKGNFNIFFFQLAYVHLLQNRAQTLHFLLKDYFVR